MRLQVRAALERAQMRDQVVFVARREQHAHEHDVRDGRLDRGDRRVARVDDDDVRLDAFLDDALDDGALPYVRFDREYQGSAQLAPHRVLRTTACYVFNMNSVSSVPTVTNTSTGALSMLCVRA